MVHEFSRAQRVADEIQRTLAKIVQRELNDPRVGFVTLKGVKISPDFANATVFVSFLDVQAASATTDKDTLVVLNRAAGFLRFQLSKALRLRTTPKLHFVIDDTVARGQQLSRLIDEALAKNNQVNSGS